MEKKVHFYSQSRIFPNLNLKYQGIEFYAFKEEISGSIPVYRFVHDETMTNFYTVNSVAERRYKKEEISFYAFDKKIDRTIPIYRFYNTINKGHFYARNKKPEKNYKAQGIEFYAILPEDYERNKLDPPIVLETEVSKNMNVPAPLAYSEDALELIEISTDLFLKGNISNNNLVDIAIDKKTAKKVRKHLWGIHVDEIVRTRSKEMEDRVIKLGNLKMKFYYKVFGKKPKNGYSLFISMHGGGGAPAKVNNKQWKNQKHLYDSTIKEGVYLAPRAPTNTWDLWHQSHIDNFFSRLIENMIVLEDVNPDRVYLMGYSAGGDGVFQVAPRMADRLAAAAMMAGHPNETSSLGLRNIGFTIHMGENDSAYNRNKVAKKWKRALRLLHQSDPKGYFHNVTIHKGKGHWMGGSDKVAIPWMKKFTRNPFPQKVVWKQDDVTHNRFYWLAEKNGTSRARVDARLDNQTITIEKSSIVDLIVMLNDEMVDMDKPVKIIYSDKEIFNDIVHRNISTIVSSLKEYGDPRAIYSGKIELRLKIPVPNVDK